MDRRRRRGVREASETIEDIRGVELEDMTAEVADGDIHEYRATVEVAFPVHEEHRGVQ